MKLPRWSKKRLYLRLVGVLIADMGTSALFYELELRKATNTQAMPQRPSSSAPTCPLNTLNPLLPPALSAFYTAAISLAAARDVCRCADSYSINRTLTSLVFAKAFSYIPQVQLTSA